MKAQTLPAVHVASLIESELLPAVPPIVPTPWLSTTVPLEVLVQIAMRVLLEGLLRPRA